MKNVFLIVLLILANQGFSQKFYLGEKINSNTNQFALLGISSDTGVATYKYTGMITDTYFFNRKIGDIIIGVKKNIIVSTIYNLIPESNDVGVPKSTLELIQDSLPFPLTYIDGVYGVRIDNTNISVSRSRNALTLNKDRIMFFTSMKNSIIRLM